MKPLTQDLLQSLPRREGNFRIYFEITDHINQYPYRLVDIPDIAALRSTYELNPSTGGPIRPPFGYEVGSGRYSINWMINSHASQIPFTFADYKECIDAAEKLHIYIGALKERGKLNDEEKAYLLRAEEFNVPLQKVARKMIAYYRVDLPEISIFKQKKIENLAKALASEGTLHKTLNKSPIKRGKQSGKFNFLGGNYRTEE